MRFGRKPELTTERVEDIRGLRQVGTTLPEIMHFTARAIGCSANEALAVLSVAMGQRIAASKVATKALQRPSWAVLDDVAECGHGALLVVAQCWAHDDAEHMEDVRLASLVDLSGMGASRNLDGAFQRVHSDWPPKPLMSLCVNEGGRVRIDLDFITCVADP